MYTVILMYEFTSKWLRLDWQQRANFRAEHINPIFEKYSGQVQAKFYDAEAFDAEISDFMILNTSDLKRYYFLMEELREAPLFADDYIKVRRILMGLEEGHLEFEKVIKNREIAL